MVWGDVVSLEKYVYQVQSSIAQDPIIDPADLDLEPGQDEPELCFSRSQVRDPAYALLDNGATHVLLPEHMLPKGARSLEVAVSLAVGKERARCWRNEGLCRRLCTCTSFSWPTCEPPRHEIHRENGEALMQCRDKGQWRTMTKFEIRNNMAYASQMQFEALRRALWVQQAQPQTVFDWKFWEKAARNPKMTAYLNHGVKVKMCEATPCVNSVGSQYIVVRAQLELACDSIRKQDPALQTCIGPAGGSVHRATDSDHQIAKCLLKDVTTAWSTLTMRTTPFPTDLFQDVHPNHQVLLSCKPHRPGCHQWRPAQSDLTADSRSPTGCHCRVLP